MADRNRGGERARAGGLDVAYDASDPAQSVIALQRLVNDNDDLVVGGWGNSQVLANMAVAERAGLPTSWWAHRTRASPPVPTSGPFARSRTTTVTPIGWRGW
jgi:hypothetical protein